MEVIQTGERKGRKGMANEVREYMRRKKKRRRRRKEKKKRTKVFDRMGRRRKKKKREKGSGSDSDERDLALFILYTSFGYWGGRTSRGRRERR